MLETPIAFLIWQRPSLTAKVFARIREVQPKQLIIIADGPKEDSPESAIRCKKTREVVENIDWPCEVFRDYSPTNMGPQDRIESGLDFIFNHVERAIILEDDCLPDLSFFPYVEELLERYADDERVGCIGGDKPAQVHVDSNYSYDFTNYTMIWGWATWRRVWQKHDRSMKLWPAAQATGFLDRLFQSETAARFWSNWFNRQYHRDMLAWDIGLTFSCWLNGMRSIIPANNLIANIGFGVDATHTLSNDDPRSNQITQRMLFPLRHPTSINNSKETDKSIEKNVFSGDGFAFRNLYRGIEFNRVHHAFGEYLDKCSNITIEKKISLLQQASSDPPNNFSLLTDNSCKEFVKYLEDNDSNFEPYETKINKDYNDDEAKSEIWNFDIHQPAIYQKGFPDLEGPFPNIGVGFLRWMVEPNGILQVKNIKGGEYYMFIVVASIADDQSVGIYVDGDIVANFEVPKSALNPLYRFRIPVRLLPGDTIIKITAKSFVSEQSDNKRKLYLSMFGMYLVRMDGEIEQKYPKAFYGINISDINI